MQVRERWEQLAQHAVWVMSPHLKKGKRVTVKKLIRFPEDKAKAYEGADNAAAVAALDGNTAPAAASRKAALIKRLKAAKAREDEKYLAGLAEDREGR